MFNMLFNLIRSCMATTGSPSGSQQYLIHQAPEVKVLPWTFRAESEGQSDEPADLSS